MRKQLTALFFIVLFFVSVNPVEAQTPELPPGPIYIVQEGDTLWDIAIRFNVGISEIITYNSLTSQEIFVGDQLVIPGLENLTGILSIQSVPFGETFRSLCRQNDIAPAELAELNRIVSPVELYAGYGLILPQQEGTGSPAGRDSLAPGETMLELAVRQNILPWRLARVNGLHGLVAGIPGDVLEIPGGLTNPSPGGFPSFFSLMGLEPLPIIQGQTVQISVALNETAILSGSLVNQLLNFNASLDGSWVALQGIHVMTTPGLYPFHVTATLPNGEVQSFEQMVLIEDGYFIQDPILQVEPSTIDPAITVPESEFILSQVSPITPLLLWQAVFQLPVDDQFKICSMYGNRRSYNSSEFIYFHTGVDYCVWSEDHPFDVYAPADGIVIFAGLLPVRGNATIIDHGWGVYSGLYHQEEINVVAGDHVSAGQLIGRIGATGRVTGPHLHWEVWVNGIQVNPLQWLEEEFPRKE